jgi:hypothetical protein
VIEVSDGEGPGKMAATATTSRSSPDPLTLVAQGSPVTTISNYSTAPDGPSTKRVREKFGYNAVSNRQDVDSDPIESFEESGKVKRMAANWEQKKEPHLDLKSLPKYKSARNRMNAAGPLVSPYYD